MRNFTAVVTRNPKSGVFFATFPDLFHGTTQAETWDELQENLRDVLSVAVPMDMDVDDLDEVSEFVGTLQVPYVVSV